MGKSDAEMLEALVRKAVNGGYDTPWWSSASLVFDDAGVEASGDWISCMDILFSHSFARALFGDNGGSSTFYIPAHEPYEEPDSIPYWEYMLQQTVVSDNPIKYMYERVFNKEQS